jgi:hypothetical protein
MEAGSAPFKPPEAWTGFLRPVVDALPPEVGRFLDAGGWWLVFAAAGLLVLLLLWLLLRALWRALFGRRRVAEEPSDADLYEDLATCPLPAQAPGERRLTLYHLPVRLRLAVVAPMGTGYTIDPITVEDLLDRVVPGLGAVARHDKPRVRVWPAQLSHKGFTIAFQRRVQRTDPPGQPSRWVLVAGKAQIGRQAVLVGLGLWSEEANTIDRVSLQPHQWLDVLRLTRGEG